MPIPIPIPSTFSTSMVEKAERTSKTLTSTFSTPRKERNADHCESATALLRSEPSKKARLGDRLDLSSSPSPSPSPSSPPSPSNKEHSSSRIRIALHPQWLLQLEGALQLFGSQTKTKRLSYAKFCTLVPKLVLTVLTTQSDIEVDHRMDTEEEEEEEDPSLRDPTLPQLVATPDHWSTEERLWHDVCCVAVPSLYELVERPAARSVARRLELHTVSLSGIVGNSDDGGVGVGVGDDGIGDDGIGDDGARRKSRPAEWQRVLQEAQQRGVSAVISRRISAFLEQVRAAKSADPPPSSANDTHTSINNQNTTASTTTTTSQASLALWKTGSPANKTDADPLQTAAAATTTTTTTVAAVSSTLEERVRAKAQKRLQHFQRAEQCHTRNGNQEDCVTVADALFSQARHILRQGRARANTNRYASASRFQTNSANINPRSAVAVGTATVPTTKCVLPFRQVVEAVPGYSSSQMSALLQEIRGKCPDWISWTAATIAKTKASTHAAPKTPARIPLNASVTIETAGYKVVRSILSGEAPPRPGLASRVTSNTTISMSRTRPFLSPMGSIMPPASDRGSASASASGAVQVQVAVPSERTPPNAAVAGSRLRLPAVTVSGGGKRGRIAVPSTNT